MATYYTYRSQVPLGSGETLGFTTGKGYYAIPAKTSSTSKPSPTSGGAPAISVTDDNYKPSGALTGTAVGGLSSGGAPVTGGPAATSTAADTITDWASYLGLFGLDSEALAAINAVKRTGNLSIDVPNILNSVRQTKWYARTYPGIGEAIAKGLVSNEADYRAQQNQFDQVYRQQYGRTITADEYAGFLKQGLSADIVNRQIQGAKYVDANRNSLQYAAGNFGDTGLLSEDQLAAVGQNKAGLGSRNGIDLQAQLDKAIARAQRIFQGTLANMSFNPAPGASYSAPKSQNVDIGR